MIQVEFDDKIYVAKGSPEDTNIKLNRKSRRGGEDTGSRQFAISRERLLSLQVIMSDRGRPG